MQNIVNYFNTFTQIIFGVDLLMTPANYLTAILGYYNQLYNEHPSDLIPLFLGRICSNVTVLFSTFVWVWFAILTFNLLLRYPFNWLRSIIRKCKIS